MSLSTPQNSSQARPFRIYTVQIAGVPHEKVIPHPDGLSGPALELYMGRAFHAWLESGFPGSEKAGAVRKVAFTDNMQPASAHGTPASPLQADAELSG